MLSPINIQALDEPFKSSHGLAPLTRSTRSLHSDLETKKKNGVTFAVDITWL